jgi:predicted PurR-regulated permease PerM
MPMSDYLRKLEKLKHHYSGGHGGDKTHGGHGDHVDVAHVARKFKKFIIIALIAGVVLFITVIILLIMAITWLFNRGDDVKTATDNITQQAQQLPGNPLSLESYIANGQVDTQRLQQTYNALPSQLQDDWLRQFNAQIQELQNQAGVSNETIKALTDLYNALNPN